VLLPKLFGEGHQGDAVEDHRKRVALSHSFRAQEGVSWATLSAQDELRGMPVAVECKPGSGRPPVPDRPEHGSAAQLTEPNTGINEERPGRVGWVRSIWLASTDPFLAL
jgi:hypothetical protein